jgi:hypothetical protein
LPRIMINFGEKDPTGPLARPRHFPLGHARPLPATRATLVR